jgi:predicted transcriptional regulator
MAKKIRRKPVKGYQSNGIAVRVSVACYRDISLIADGVDRPRGWVVEQAIAQYALIQDLNEQSGLGRKLEVRA